MLRPLLRLLVCLFFAVIPWLPSASAQAPPPNQPAKPVQPAPAPPAPADAEQGEQSFAVPYAILLIYTLLVMTIVCMPSRKA